MPALTQEREFAFSFGCLDFASVAKDGIAKKTAPALGKKTSESFPKTTL